jgi:hypothetical protein
MDRRVRLPLASASFGHQCCLQNDRDSLQYGYLRAVSASSHTVHVSLYLQKTKQYVRT